MLPVPNGTMLSALGTQVDAGGREREDAFQPARIADERGTRGAGLFSRGVPALTTILRLGAPEQDGDVWNTETLGL